MESSSALLVEALYAIGIGLMVGLEREHHDLSFELAPTEEPGEGKAHRDTALGGRTFALLGLAGWLLALLDERTAWALPLGVAAIATTVILQQRINPDIGLTTEIAAIVVTLLGAVVHRDRALAIGLALATTLLLVAKPWTRSLLVRARRIEVTATVQLLILVAIVLPMLPVEPVDPWDAIKPRKVGTFIVAIAGVQYVGYVLTRILGPERGVGLAGLVGGLSSSTAVTVSMARAARENDAAIGPGRLAVFLANTVMPVRVIVLASLISPEVGVRVAIPLGVMAVVLLGAALVQWRRLRRDAAERGPAELKVSNPLALWSALSWGVLFCVILLVSKLATSWFGSSGLLIAALVSGLADVDAVTLAAAEHGHTGDVAWAVLAVVIAVASNTVVKAGLALSGGRKFGGAIAAVFAVAIAVATAVAVVELTMT